MCAHECSGTHWPTLGFGLLVVWTKCYTRRPTCSNQCCTHPIAPSWLQQIAWTCTRSLFIIIYKKNKEKKSLLLPTSAQNSGSAGSLDDGLKLVDPCQLFHNLNNLVHCGFTLHAAAVIDLKSGKAKQWALLCASTARPPSSETSG